MTDHNDHATLIRLNKDHPEGVDENVDKTIVFTENMEDVISH